jgi:hypothetical protein
VQLLRDQGILRPRAEAEADDDDDVEEAEGWGSEEEEEEEEDGDVIIPMPGQALVSVGAMVVGTGEQGFQDGAAAAAMFRYVRAMLQLPDGCVLVADFSNYRIRMLSADLQQVSTVAGDGGQGHRDGAAGQAQFDQPRDFALLPDGRVLVAGFNNTNIRVLSADLQQVSTLTNVNELENLRCLELLPDGRLLVGERNRIRVLEGFPAALLGTKPSHKPPKKTNQQQKKKKKKRALAGGASSSGLVPKRSRSGASSSSAAAAAAVSSSDSEEGEEQPGGSAAEAEPLL